jgi:hypothetical protein
MTVFDYRMGHGFPGGVTRLSHTTIEPMPFDPNKPFADTGLPGKIVGETFVPMEAGDTAADLYGFLVRDYPTAMINAGVADILKRGYLSVQNNAGSPSLNKPVFIRVGGATTAQPIGGIEAEADATAANTIQINAIFMSEGDSTGSVEIAYNI